MRLDKLKAKRLLTYEELDYDFENRPLLVQGVNLTDEGQKSNGSGKSALQTAIEFAIAASNSRGIPDAELVSYGEKNAQIELFASCDIRKVTLHIDWTINVKGSNKLKLKEKTYGLDTWSDVSFSTSPDGKKYILSWFAISKDDLFNYYIINNSRFKSFFKSSNTEKVDLINRFSDASIVTDIDKIDNTKLQSEHDTLEAEISRLDGKIELTEENIDKENNRDLESEFKEKEDELGEEIENVELLIKKQEEFIKNLVPEEAELNKDIERQEIKKSEHKIRLKEKESEVEKISADVRSSRVKVEAASDLVVQFKCKDWNRERKGFEDEKKEFKSDLVEATKEKKASEVLENKILKALKSIEVDLSGAISCPKCDHEFLLDGDIGVLEQKEHDLLQAKEKVIDNVNDSNEDIDELKGAIEEVEESISGINSLEKKENTALHKVKEALNGVKENFNKLVLDVNTTTRAMEILRGSMIDCDTKISSIELKILGLDQKNISYNDKISSYEVKIKGIEDSINALKPIDNKSILKGLRFEKSVFEKDRDAKQKDISEVGDKIYSRNKWALNFKQFRMFLANESLETMEFHNNRFLSDIGSDLRIKLEGFKVLAKGDIKEEITATIVRDRQRSFGSFSGGERGRLLFASILANRYMINSTHPYGGLDFLSIDEVFEGVDGVGLKSLIESSKRLNITVMLITHVSDEDASSDILRVVKENGVSRLTKEVIKIT